jgi:glycosyltransferase involved in cell wall biosynthesis
MTELRVLMIQVGNPIADDDPCESRLRMKALDGAGERWYRKKDIINATDQMRSLAAVGVRVEYGFLSGRRSFAALARAWIRIRSLARQHEVQLVHALWGITTSLLTVLAGGWPVVISFSGSDLFGEVDGRGRRTLKGRVSRCVSQLSALGARRIIVKSEKMRRVLWPFTRQKAVVIPNGVDLLRFTPVSRDDARARLGWPVDDRVMLFFPSGGAPVKNAALAAAVVERVRAEMPGARLEAVSDVAHDDLVLYYSAADVMLLTSFHEGSNNSLKEAMCCNLPVVSVDCGDSRERLAGVGNSFLVDAYDAQRLADAVLRVLRSGERSNGRESVAAIDLPQIARRVRRVYDEALGPR